MFCSTSLDGGAPGVLNSIVMFPGGTSRRRNAPFSATPPETYAAFLRALKKSVRRINADKRRYVSYFLQDHPDKPEVQSLRPEDFNLDRVRLMEPTPIPEEQARWAWEWMSGWGILHGDFDVKSQINQTFQREAHELAAT